jgi:hypothetical protein
MNVIIFVASFLSIVLCAAHTGDKTAVVAGSSGTQTQAMTSEDHIRRRRHIQQNHSFSILEFTHTGESKDDSMSRDNNNSIPGTRHSYHVAEFDFANVATPFVVSLWIVFASVAKIGRLTHSMFLIIRAAIWS